MSEELKKARDLLRQAAKERDAEAVFEAVEGVRAAAKGELAGRQRKIVDTINAFPPMTEAELCATIMKLVSDHKGMDEGFMEIIIHLLKGYLLVAAKEERVLVVVDVFGGATVSHDFQTMEKPKEMH